MALLDGVGDFFNQLSGSITGANKNALTDKSLTIQQQIAQQTLQNDLALAQLKYNPTLSKQRTQQIAVVGAVVVVIAGLIIYFKFGR